MLSMRFLNKKGVKSTNVNYLIHNGKNAPITKDSQIFLIISFTNIGPSLANKLPNANKTFKDWMNATCPTKLCFQEISLDLLS